MVVSTNGLIKIVDGSSLATPQDPISFGGSIAATAICQIASFAVQEGSNSVLLPINTILFANISNLSTDNPITVTWTPAGEFSAEIIDLQPSDYIQLNSSAGVRNLTISCTATASAAMVLAGISVPLF